MGFWSRLFGTEDKQTSNDKPVEKVKQAVAPPRSSTSRRSSVERGASNNRRSTTGGLYWDGDTGNDKPFSPGPTDSGSPGGDSSPSTGGDSGGSSTGGGD